MRRNEASRGELPLTTSTRALSSSALARQAPLAEGRAPIEGSGCARDHKDSAVGGSGGGGCGCSETVAPSLERPTDKRQTQTQAGVARTKLESGGGGGAEGVAERGRRCNASSRRELGGSSRVQVSTESCQYEPGEQTHQLMLEPEAEQGAAKEEEERERVASSGAAAAGRASGHGQPASVSSEEAREAPELGATGGQAAQGPSPPSSAGQARSASAGNDEQTPAGSHLLSSPECGSDCRSASSRVSTPAPAQPARRHVPQYVFNETTFYSQPAQASMPELLAPLASHYSLGHHQLVPACHFGAHPAAYYPAQLAPPVSSCAQHCCAHHYAQPAGRLSAARSQAAYPLVPHPQQPPPLHYHAAESADTIGAQPPGGMLWLPAGLLVPPIYDYNYLAVGFHLGLPASSLYLSGNYHAPSIAAAPHLAASLQPPPPPPTTTTTLGHLQSVVLQARQAHLARGSTSVQAGTAPVAPSAASPLGGQCKLGYGLMRLLPIDAQPARRRQAYGMDKVWQDEFEQLFAHMDSNITWTLVEVEKNPDIRQHSHRLLAYKSRYIVCTRSSLNSDGGSTSGQGSSVRSSAESTTSSHDVQLQQAPDSSELLNSLSPPSGSLTTNSPESPLNDDLEPRETLDSQCADDLDSSTEIGRSMEACSEDGADEFGHDAGAHGLELADSTSTTNSATESSGYEEEEQQAAEVANADSESDQQGAIHHEQNRQKPKHEFPLRFRMFIDSAKVRFCCDNCGHGWTSMKGRVVFWYELFELVDDELYADETTTAIITSANESGATHAHEAGNIIGYCAYKLFGQQCDVCKVENRFESPMWYPEEVAKVLSNLYNKIGQVYFGFKMPAIDRQRRAGKPKTSHNSSLCQACHDGVCADRK